MLSRSTAKPPGARGTQPADDGLNITGDWTYNRTCDFHRIRLKQAPVGALLMVCWTRCVGVGLARGNGCG